MNLQLPPGAVYSLQLTSEVLAVVLDALATRPYGQVAPIMAQFLSEIGRQNALSQAPKGANGSELPAPEVVQ